MAARIDLTYAQLAHFVEMAQQVIDDFAAMDNPSLNMAIQEDENFRMNILSERMFNSDGEATEVVASMDVFGNVKMKQQL